MKWLMEYMRIIDPAPDWLGFPDDNDAAMLRAFKELGRNYIEIKQVPFTETLIGIETLDLDHEPSLIYGSCQIIEKVRKQYPLVSTYYEPYWFDSAIWCANRTDMLNQEILTTTVGRIRDHWVLQPTFIKSLRVKALNGMVIEPDKKDRDDWLIEHSHLDRDELVSLSKVHDIYAEYRFFVVGGDIITGSTYKKDYRRAIREPIPQDAWEAANKAIKDWMPSQTIVIDICKLRTGEYKVVEFNCISSSGFYNSDVTKLVERLETEAQNDFNRKT